jgi:hypothetical protein
VRVVWHGRLRIDAPVVDPIRRTRCAQMGKATPIFDATEQQCIAIG